MAWVGTWAQNLSLASLAGGGRGRRVDPDWCFTSFADAAPKGAAGEGPQLQRKTLGPQIHRILGPQIKGCWSTLNPEKELGPQTQRKNLIPSTTASEKY